MIKKGVIKREDIFDIKASDRFHLKIRILLNILIFINKITFGRFEKQLLYQYKIIGGRIMDNTKFVKGNP